AASHEVFDQAAAWREVVEIELVDLRGDDQQRTAVHLFGGRRVLDQLQHVAREDDGPRREGEIAAHLELAGVYLRGQAAVAEQVVDHVPQAARHAAAARLQQLAQRSRIAEQRVGRRRGIDE